MNYSILKPALSGLFVFLLFLLNSAELKAEDNPDPWEGFNRSMFAVNETLDKWILKPAAQGYAYVTPKPVNRSVGNFLNNLKEPSVFVSNLLQLKITDATVDVSRFVINSTVGFFGAFDVASKIGLESNNEDFGQVLGYWGVPSGPYIVLPVLGFYTARSLTGEIGVSLSGIGYTAWGQNSEQKLGLFALNVIHQRAGFLEQEKLIMGDKYTFIRSVYLQRRAYLVNDGKANTNDDAEFEDEFNDGFDELGEDKTNAKDEAFADDDWMFENNEEASPEETNSETENTDNAINTNTDSNTNTSTDANTASNTEKNTEIEPWTQNSSLALWQLALPPLPLPPKPLKPYAREIPTAFP